MLKLTLTTIALSATLMASGHAGNIQTPGPKPLNVTDVTLAIKGPDTNVCPAAGEMKAWIYANKPGPVSYFVVRKGQTPGPMKVAQATTKAANGKYVAVISNEFPIVNAINAEYRLAARGEGDYVGARWVRLQTNCQG